MDWIVTDDIYQETWRRLLEYANVDFTLDELVRRHGKPISHSTRSNYLKQARQARVAVLQAKEYFDASATSSLFTRANQLYYGIVALSSFMMLMLGDGTRSLDYLRRDKKNRSHGLDFSTGATASNASQGLTLLNMTHAKILSNGHFYNWYTTLPAQVYVPALVSHEMDAGVITSLQYFGAYNIASVAELVEKKRSAIDLLKYFPDMHRDLFRYGLHVPLSRMTHKITQTRNKKIQHTWLIHGAPSEQDRNEILAHFSSEVRFAGGFSFSLEDNQSGGIVQFAYDAQEHVRFQWPSARDTMSHDSISYAAEINTPEIVDHFLLAYQLSMLSRYFPDLWVACIESQCRAAKLIEKSVQVLMKKAPILTLSLLTPGGIVISTHREPWRTE